MDGVYLLLTNLAQKGDITLRALGNKSQLLYKDVVILDGTTQSEQSPNTTGWVFDGSRIGAPSSTGVEALREKLTNQGRDDLANLLPRYHICDFWRDDTFAFGFTSTDSIERFATPDLTSFGLEWHQGDELVRALLNQDHFYFLMAIAGDPNKLMRMYRGAEGDVGFTQGDTIYGNGQGRGLTSIDGKPHRPLVGAPYALDDHFVYDIYFRSKTDEDITRYWTNWARCWGAAV
jgi:hypothetical protein